MSVVLIKETVTANDLVHARKDYGDFVKFVVDIESNNLAIGGEWHSDAEEILRNSGSKQENLWGGGVDLFNKDITYSAMTNIKPGVNSGHVILIDDVRKKVENLVKMKFDL